MTEPVRDVLPAFDALTPGEQEQAELEDWNAYFRLLLSGALKSYGGTFVVVHKGKVAAAGDDLELRRSELAEQFGVDHERLVIAFVDDTECISAE